MALAAAMVRFGVEAAVRARQSDAADHHQRTGAVPRQQQEHDAACAQHIPRGLIRDA